MIDWFSGPGIERLASAWVGVLVVTGSLRVLVPNRAPRRATAWLLVLAAVLVAAAWGAEGRVSNYLRVAGLGGLGVAWGLVRLGVAKRGLGPAVLAGAAGVATLAAEMLAIDVPAAGWQRWIPHVHFVAASLLAATALESALLLTGGAPAVDGSEVDQDPRWGWRWLARLALVSAAAEFGYAAFLLLGGMLPARLAAAEGMAQGIYRPVVALAIALGSFVAWQVPHRVETSQRQRRPLEQPLALRWAAWIGAAIFVLLVGWT